MIQVKRTKKMKGAKKKNRLFGRRIRLLQIVNNL